MKMIVDIPDEDYEYIMSGYIIYSALDVIKNGTPLPEHHGRLIDADELIQDIIDDNQLCIFNSESERIFHDKMVDFAIDRIADALTVIEADKEVKKNEDSD